MTSISDTTRTGAPRPVNTSYWLYVTSAVIGLVSFVISLILLPSVVSATEQRFEGQSTHGVDVHAVALGAAIGGAVLGGLIAVAFFVLTLVFAAKMRNGRNWARIVLLVFAVLHVLGLLGLAAGNTPALSAVVSLVVTIAAVAAAILSFLPESNAWFRSTKQVPAPAV
jgi:uncharacterized membrane protein YhaH (DUF805 family)